VSVELLPVTEAVRERVLALAPRPEQERFAGRPPETLPDAEADPDRHPVAIVEDGEPVGFFVLHRGAAPDAAADEELLLRAFFVDAAAQGRGIAGQALSRLGAFVAEHLPGARRVVLTVNVANPVAVRVYLRAGFADTGERSYSGAHGPQHILVLDL
jgi:RimJ/RimL family protein N-acetyltransferase